MSAPSPHLIFACFVLFSSKLLSVHSFDVVITRQELPATSDKQNNKALKYSSVPERGNVEIIHVTEEYVQIKVVRHSGIVYINLTKSDDLCSNYETSNDCFYGRGTVSLTVNTMTKVSNSWAALTICRDIVEGFLLLRNVGFILESNNIDYAERSKRDVAGSRSAVPRSFFNLTGDTFDSPWTRDAEAEHNRRIFPMPANLETSSVHNAPRFASMARQSSSESAAQRRRNNKANRVYTSHAHDGLAADIDSFESNFTKRRNRRIDSQSAGGKTKSTIGQHNYENFLIEQTDEELGYFYDSAWKSVMKKTRPRSFSRNPHRFLEIVIAVDDSVIKFHGRVRVKQYVLTLMNIVNALYQDPSLEANLQIVIRDLHLFEKRRSVIKLGNAKKSLENVNLWNKDLHRTYRSNDAPHDIALWLTRTDIGGPSGYAPVGGVCDPERSCALTRDEGLTCAFIIAHELAHILGLSHDGDSRNNNTCRDEALHGSVMAPMVSATFHHFLWSECSRREFNEVMKLYLPIWCRWYWKYWKSRSQWQCLLNAPDAKRSIELNSTLGARFTMDEQCRVEFGEGYELCRSFDIVEPCAHLWCGHVKSPLVCKTKKAPPLEGTECGLNKWCIDGYCDNTLRLNLDPLKYNPQDGGWSAWGPWTSCSRSCGLGIQFRSRTCDNPKPAYGGLNCDGSLEEWKVCNVQNCPDINDYRAQQCTRMPKLLDVPTNLTWLPYESIQANLKCNFICQSKETGEIYTSDEFLVDGTLCSYDWNNKRCVQGQCVTIGCDHNENSTLIEDSCGVCNGNNSECLRIKSNVTKKIKKQITRLGVLHNQARHIAIEFSLEAENPAEAAEIDFDLFLKDRKRNAVRIHKAPFGGEFNHGLPRENNAHPNDVPIGGNRQDLGLTPQDGISVTIVHGAKFRLHAMETTNALLRHNETMFLSTQGPLLKELVLFIEIKNFQLTNNIKLKLEMEYLLHKKLKDTRYEWIVGGWGSCSTSCGGGKMFKTKACVEKSTQRIVARKLCSIVNKPPTEARTCNDFSCNFMWIPGEWEPCSATCGQDGVQQREIYCVPQNLQNDTQDLQTAPWKYMLPPTKCGYQPLSTIRPCNRTTCPGHWEYSKWSECSTSCGLGSQIRLAECKSDSKLLNDTDVFCSLNLTETMQIRSCDNEYYDTIGHETDLKLINPCGACNGDTSPFCAIDSLNRYCKYEVFRNICCKTCELISHNSQTQ